MKEFDKSDFETAGANYGEKVAKVVYTKFGAEACILGDIIGYEVDVETLIHADADEIIEEVGGMKPAHERILRSICKSMHTSIIKTFPMIEDDFNFEDDFADEYGDSPANVYNSAFWNEFYNTLNQLQMN